MTQKTFFIKYLNQSGGVESVLKSTQQQALNLTHTGFGNFHNSAGNWRWDEQSRRYILSKAEQEVKAVDKVEKKESKVVAPPAKAAEPSKPIEPPKATELPKNVIPFKKPEPPAKVTPDLVPAKVYTGDKTPGPEMAEFFKEREAKEKEASEKAIGDLMDSLMDKDVYYDGDFGKVVSAQIRNTNDIGEPTRPYGQVEILLPNGQKKTAQVTADFKFNRDDWSLVRPFELQKWFETKEDWEKKKTEGTWKVDFDNQKKAYYDKRENSSVVVTENERRGRSDEIRVVDKNKKWAATIYDGYDVYIKVYDNIENFGKRGDKTNETSIAINKPDTRDSKYFLNLKHEITGMKFASKEEFINYVEKRFSDTRTTKHEYVRKTSDNELPNFANKKYEDLKFGDFTFFPDPASKDIQFTHKDHKMTQGFQGYIGYKYWLPLNNYDRLLKMKNEISGMKSIHELERYLTTRKMSPQSVYMDPDR